MIILQSLSNIVYHPNCPFKPEDHKEDTGPEMCPNCRCYGTGPKGWMGYCRNCALYDYSFSRGLPLDIGFEGQVEEYSVNECIDMIESKPNNKSLSNRNKYKNVIEISLLKLKTLPLEFLSLIKTVYKDD